MTARDKRIVASVVGVNALYVMCLTALMILRNLSGTSPLPFGFGPWVLMASTLTPTLTVMLGGLARARSPR
jgi:hypothetical protein